MPLSVAFRIFLLIVIIIAVFMLLPIIKNLRLNAKAAETEQQQEQVTEEEKPQVEKPAKPVAKPKPQDKPEKKPKVEKPAKPVAKPQDQTPVSPAERAKASEGSPPEKKPQAEKPATPAQPATAPAQPSTPPVQPPPAQTSSPQPVKPAENRGSIYLIQESNKMLVKVNRNLNPNTPLTDSINALLAGPAPDEIMSGIESFVPEGSRLLSARVEGTTAVLNFNKEFTYNTRGREGCEFQIKQIVWTATEFPNVLNVQFLIDGKEVNFLSEGVVIRNPIGR